VRPLHTHSTDAHLPGYAVEKKGEAGQAGEPSQDARGKEKAADTPAAAAGASEPAGELRSGSAVLGDHAPVPSLAMQP
jgi:hypothetical protein